MIQDLVEYRELKARGARIDNAAAAADVRLTLDRFNTEVSWMADSLFIQHAEVWYLDKQSS